MDNSDIINPLAHIAVIPDGARRWAQQNDRSLYESYRISLGKLKEYVEWFYFHGISSVTLFLMSRQNFGRQAHELDPLLKILREPLTKSVRELVSRWQCELRVVGNQDRLREHRLNDEYDYGISDAVRIRKLFLCIGYDPFEEMSDCISTVESSSTTDEILEHLWIPERIQLVIRTGGAVTLSGLAPLQASYARLIFLPELFNDVTLGDLQMAVRMHEMTDPLFGK